MNSLSGKELIGMYGLTQTVKEERQIVVVVQLLYLNLQTCEIIFYYNNVYTQWPRS